MTETEERAYLEGHRRANMELLQHAMGQLDRKFPREAEWLLERQEAIAALRELCGHFGDNDWPDDLALADIIGKHLADHLHETNVGG